MLSWPSSHRIRYRGDGSPRTTSSTTPERGRRAIDSDSATTRLPTAKASLTPDFFVVASKRRVGTWRNRCGGGTAADAQMRTRLSVTPPACIHTTDLTVTVDPP